MNRIYRLVTVALVAVMMISLAGYAAAIEEVLIDFSLLTADTPANKPLHNSASLLRFADLYSTTTGLSLSNEERELVQLSLAIPQWRFTFNSSLAYPTRIRSSGIRAATVNQSASKYGGSEVLGLRLNFPAGSDHSWVLIEPPYRIPRVPQELLSGTAVDFSQRGVISNVDQIQSISIEVYGLNYPHRISILYEDTDGVVKERFLGSMNFTGWNTLTWENSGYTPPVEAEGEAVVDTKIRYPQNFSNIAFRGIRIWKSGAFLVGDFVGYIKEVRVNYEPTPANVDSDFDNEKIWNVLTDEQRRENRRRQVAEGTGAVYEIIGTNINN